MRLYREVYMQSSTTPTLRDQWHITETDFNLDRNAARETLFAIGNGHIGVRGSHEEGFDGFASNSADGTFINGFYDATPVSYAESGYGWPTKQQFMLKVPNAKCINFSID